MATATQEPDQARQQTGIYLYGIVPGDVEIDDDVGGVGDPPAAVQVLRHGDVAAIVSELPVDRPLGRPEDLTAHQNVLDMIAVVAPVLPVRFGTVVTDADAITDGLLGSMGEQIATALDGLEGQVEYIIHGRYSGDVALREVLDENPDAARLRDAIGDGSEDDTREARVQLGEFINRAVEAKRQQDTSTVADAVGDVATSVIARDPSHEDDAVYIAVLVHADDEKRLHHTVDDLARQWDGRIRLRLIGPMAAYDFAVLPGD